MKSLILIQCGMMVVITKPYDLTYELQRKIIQKHKKGKIFHSRPNTWIGVDKSNVFHGLAYIKVKKSEGLIVKSAMRSKTYPVFESDLLESIIIYELYDKFLSCKYKLILMSSIYKEYKNYAGKYKLRLSSGYSTGDDYV